MFKNLKQGDYYMENIKKLVEKLEEEFDEKKQIEILQDIGAMLINNYVIKVGDLMIEPMLVEAYYYHKGKFEDESVYSAKMKKPKRYCMHVAGNKIIKENYLSIIMIGE